MKSIRNPLVAHSHKACKASHQQKYNVSYRCINKHTSKGKNRNL